MIRTIINIKKKFYRDRIQAIWLNEYDPATTSEAKDSLFFSPPEIPRSLPGIPMNVSAQLKRPSFRMKKQKTKNKKTYIYILKT